MGSSKSKVQPQPSKNATEETNSRPMKTTRTGCFAGIKNVFSRKTKASRSDADDDDESLNDDVGQLQQTTTAASVIPAPADVTPAKLHHLLLKAVRSDPIGQKHMPIIRQEVKSSPVIGQKFRSGRPSSSHPADIRVSSGYFLYYHRYVNDDSDRESLDEDTSDQEDEPVFDADIESDQDKTTAPKMVIRRRHRSAHSGKRGKTPKSGVARVKGKNSAKVYDDVSSDDETSHVTRQRKRVKKTKLKVTERIDGAFNDDVISDNEATSQVDTDSVDKMNVFLASLSIVATSLPVVLVITEVLVFLGIAKQAENEKPDRDGNGLDQEAVVETPDGGARTAPEARQRVQNDDVYESDWETCSSSETDLDQPEPFM